MSFITDRKLTLRIEDDNSNNQMKYPPAEVQPICEDRITITLKVSRVDLDNESNRI